MTGELTVATSDGWPLSVEVRAPAGAPIGVAVCLHAMMCDRRTLDRPRGAGLASALVRAGVEALLVDLRGHGRSARGARPWSYDDLVYRDIPAVLAAAAERHPGRPVALLGHSLGAHAGLAALIAGARAGASSPPSPAAVVSLAGNLWLPQTEPDPARRAVKRAVMTTWGAVSRVVGRFPSRALRVGTDDEALPYVRQLVGFTTSGRWRSTSGEDWLTGMRAVSAPVLSVTSVDDRWMCHPRSAAAWLAGAPSVQHRVVGERAGDPRGVDHMGLATDRRMAPVHAEIAEWVRARLAV